MFLVDKILALNPINWIKEMLAHQGRASSKRTVMVVSAFCLCFCLVVLTGTVMWVLIKNPKDHKLDGNIVLLYTALTVPIAGLAGTVYVGKKEIPEDTTLPSVPKAPVAPKPPINKDATQG
jgi:hypothetical protein